MKLDSALQQKKYQTKNKYRKKRKTIIFEKKGYSLSPKMYLMGENS